MKATDSLRTRSSLLMRMRDFSDQGAWEDFCQTYGKLIRHLALSAGLREDEADEVVQEVFVNVSRHIGAFHYDRSTCSFKHWLSQSVRWRIRDQFRRRSLAPALGLDDEDDAIQDLVIKTPGVSDFDARWDEEWENYLLMSATRRVRRRVRPKHFQAFYLHVLRQVPAADVAKRLNTTAAQVYLSKLRVGRVFRKEVEALRRVSE